MLTRTVLIRNYSFKLYKPHTELIKDEVNEAEHPFLLLKKYANSCHLNQKQYFWIAYYTFCMKENLPCTWLVIQYICRSKEVTCYRKKHPTFPQRTLPAVAIKSESLPPPLHGCNCSVCNSQQSMGAMTVGKMAGHSCRSK